MFDTRFIPDEIKALPQWVGAKKGSKTPLYFNYVENKVEAASSSNPETWTTFEKITEGIVKNHFDNYGFVFHDNGIVGIDIDIGFGDDGFLSPVAIDIMGKCRSYTEYSRSRRGMHILVRGTLPFGGRNNRKGVEIYQNGRFFIVTGEKLIFPTIIENQAAIDYIVEKYFPEVIIKSDSTVRTENIYKPTVRVVVENERWRIIREYPEIGEGCRNISLTSLAGQLYNQGYSRDAVMQELIRVNAIACKPPLETKEIKSIVKSVTRYARG